MYCEPCRHPDFAEQAVGILSSLRNPSQLRILLPKIGFDQFSGCQEFQNCDVTLGELVLLELGCCSAAALVLPERRWTVSLRQSQGPAEMIAA